MLFTLLCLALGKPKRVLKPNMDDNILYVTESNISLAFQDLPAVFLLVQLGSDRDARFRTRADFLAAASSLGTRCFFAVMDGDRNTRFVKNINQREAAAFLFYRYGQLVARYSGSQSTERIVDFAMARTGIPFKTFDDYTVAQDFIESHQIAVVLYLEKAGGPLFDKYTRVAGTLRDNFSFGLCPDEVLADELGVTKVPSLVMYRSTDKGRIEYSDDLNGAELADIFAWLNYNVKPRFEPFQVDNQRVYWNNKPILLFFTSVEEEAMKEGDKVITAIAEQYGHDLQVLTIDAVTGNRFMTSIGFGRYADPAAAILVYDRKGKMTKYLHNEDDPFTVEDLAPFVEDFLDKKLKPNVKSAQLPKPNDGPVFEVNAETFQDAVINTTQASVVLYYEDWDRIYNEFLPDFTELAETFKTAKFAKFNVAQNDILAGPDPPSTPIVYLFRSKAKAKPVQYKGKLNKAALTEYLQAELDTATDL